VPHTRTIHACIELLERVRTPDGVAAATSGAT
jgi:hypothetical protein